MIWREAIDTRTQRLAAARGARGPYWIRWVRQTYYLFLDGKFLRASRDVTRLRATADQFDEDGWLR